MRDIYALIKIKACERSNSCNTDSEYTDYDILGFELVHLISGNRVTVNKCDLAKYFSDNTIVNKDEELLDLVGVKSSSIFSSYFPVWREGTYYSSLLPYTVELEKGLRILTHVQYISLIKQDEFSLIKCVAYDCKKDSLCLLIGDRRKIILDCGYSNMSIDYINKDFYVVDSYLNSTEIQQCGLDFSDLIPSYQEDSNGLVCLGNIVILTNSLCGDVIIPSNCDTIAIGSPIDISIDRLVVPPSVKRVMGECKLSKPIEIYMSKKLPGEIKNKLCKSLIADRKYHKHIKFY
jgi:hypothetical protein